MIRLMAIIGTTVARRGEAPMAIHDLNLVVRLGVGCPKCQRESLYPAAVIIERTALTCICGGTIDLSRQEWVAFRGGLADALVNLHPLYARIPTKAQIS